MYTRNYHFSLHVDSRDPLGRYWEMAWLPDGLGLWLVLAMSGHLSMDPKIYHKVNVNGKKWLNGCLYMWWKFNDVIAWWGPLWVTGLYLFYVLYGKKYQIFYLLNLSVGFQIDLLWLTQQNNFFNCLWGTCFLGCGPITIYPLVVMKAGVTWPMWPKEVQMRPK